MQRRRPVAGETARSFRPGPAGTSGNMNVSPLADSGPSSAARFMLFQAAMSVWNESGWNSIDWRTSIVTIGVGLPMKESIIWH